MKVERTRDEIIIKIPNNIDISGIERFFDFIKYKESTNNSSVSDEIVDNLSMDINKSIWQEYKKKRLIK